MAALSPYDANASYDRKVLNDTAKNLSIDKNLISAKQVPRSGQRGHKFIIVCISCWFEYLSILFPWII